MHLSEQFAHLGQCLVDHCADEPQWVSGGHEVIELLEVEQAFGEGISAAC
ncbi:hypothetical protein [Aquabacterium sp.]|nr:hypothetical protein [Aquabacterium sp.]